MTYCKDCENKHQCPFFENDDDECVYAVLVELKKEWDKREKRA